VRELAHDSKPVRLEALSSRAGITVEITGEREKEREYSKKKIRKRLGERERLSTLYIKESRPTPCPPLSL
jgi:hypothetical protein